MVERHHPKISNPKLHPYLHVSFSSTFEHIFLLLKGKWEILHHTVPDGLSSILFAFVCLLLSSSTLVFSETKTYIVHMDASAMPASIFSSYGDWYSSKITGIISQSSGYGRPYSLAPEDIANQRILYTYQTALHGFAVRLTSEEVDQLESQDGVISVLLEIVYQLHTTRSPSFLGLDLPESVSGAGVDFTTTNSSNDVIIGIIDTGIWPESQSFNDNELSPAPTRWRGACETGRGFTRSNCNNKLIGARAFYQGYEATAGKMKANGSEYNSARDQNGHGTHIASIAAGSPIRGANFFGYAPGTARGMAPGARIAAYKVCWEGGCYSSDIISAINTAVADGVDVLSISLGGRSHSYYDDAISIATFGAMEMGVFISCSAGNDGPLPLTIANVAPWVITVGASTLDRHFPATVDLGSGHILKGESIYEGRQLLPIGKQYSLVYLRTYRFDPSGICEEGFVDPKLASGKIVICDKGDIDDIKKGKVVKEAGGVGMILANTESEGEGLYLSSHLLPTVALGKKNADIVRKYAIFGHHANTTGAFWFLGTQLGVKPSPTVAYFSSRGPNYPSAYILKPDVVASGSNIISAWTGLMGPSPLASDKRRVWFNILSGTSMACPHVSGVAALLRAHHPDWSPAAIKSALMTTAYVHERGSGAPMLDNANMKLSNPYAHGSGHINPVRALGPGLIYDINPQDYYEFLCSSKLEPNQLKVFSNSTKRVCKKKFRSPGDLNYPAISVLNSKSLNNNSLPWSCRRTVTNVGPAISNYRVKVSKFNGVSVDVEPRELRFTTKNQKLTYKVTFRALTPPQYESGYMVWKDGVHRVRSPIVIDTGIDIYM